MVMTSENNVGEWAWQSEEEEEDLEEEQEKGRTGSIFRAGESAAILHSIFEQAPFHTNMVQLTLLRIGEERNSARQARR